MGKLMFIKKISSFCIGFLIINFILNLQASVLRLLPPKTPCQVEGMFGTQPQAICNMIALFNNYQKTMVRIEEGSLRMILHGPPGNGKSMLAKKIADETNSKFLPHSASSIVDPFQGSGAKKIKEMFTEAKQYTDKDQPVVLFIDEIDCIGSKKIDSKHHDSQMSLKELIQEISNSGFNRNLLIIGATNKIECLDKTLESRFDKEKVVELNNPDLNQRKDIIQNVYKTAQVKFFDEQVLPARWNYMKPEYREIYKEFHEEIVKVIKSLNEDIGYFVPILETSEAGKKIENIKSNFDKLKDLQNNFAMQFHCETSNSKHDFETFYNKYFVPLNDNIFKIDEYLRNSKAILEDKYLTSLAESTEGLSKRQLVFFANKILPLINDENISKKLSEVLKKIRDDMAENNKIWSSDDKEELEFLKSITESIASQVATKCYGIPEKANEKTTTTTGGINFIVGINGTDSETQYDEKAYKCAQDIIKSANYDYFVNRMWKLLAKYAT